ncbi:MAG: NUDIX domain-containing protein [Alphaproteobacteria bacterium]
MDRNHVFITDDSTLVPDDAAVAIIRDDEGKYLLQHRDEKPGIFFPDHWGFFGGALEPGETPAQALIRELAEELDIHVEERTLNQLTVFGFDFEFAGGPRIDRTFFELSPGNDQLRSLDLGEGQDFGFFSGDEALTRLRLAPYDGFALWIHSNQDRIARG